LIHFFKRLNLQGNHIHCITELPGSHIAVRCGSAFAVTHLISIVLQEKSSHLKKKESFEKYCCK